MKIRFSTLVFLGLIIFAWALVALPSMSADTYPPHYDQVKAALGYADAIDIPDSDQTAARAALRFKADESMAALEKLFTETTEDSHRTAIVGVFHYATGSRAEIALFLADQLRKSPEFASTVDRMQEKTWLREAFRFLAELEPETVRQVARTALATSTNLCAQVESLQALEKVGKKEDIALLNSYATKEHSDETTRIPDVLASWARRISAAISARSSP